jgi:hypothetical protein
VVAVAVEGTGAAAAAAATVAMTMADINSTGAGNISSRRKQMHRRGQSTINQRVAAIAAAERAIF